MPTANAEDWIESGGGVGKVSEIRVFRYLQMDTGPRRSPSACSETFAFQSFRNGLDDCSAARSPPTIPQHPPADHVRPHLALHLLGEVRYSIGIADGRSIARV